MKKLLILFSFFLLANIGCTVSDPEMMELLVEINNQNKELLAEVKSLKSKSDSLINEIKSSSAKQEELIKKVNLLQGEIGKVLLDISKLAEDIKKQGVDIELIKSQLADLQKKYDQIIIQLEQLQQLSKILAEIENLKAQLKDLDGKYLVVINSLGQNQQALDALKSQVTLLQNQMAQNLIKISELTTLLGKQGVDIGKILAEIAELKKSTEEIKKSLEELLSGGSPVPTNDLVAWYPFNGNANDESGNGYDAIINGAALTSDRFLNPNKSLAFDGVNDWVQLTKKLPDLTTFTLSVWVYHTKDSRSGIFSDATTDSGNDLFFNVSNNEIGILADKQNTELRRLVIPGTLTVSPAHQSTSNLNSSWQHLVWVLTPNVSTLYLNGVLIETINSKGSNVGFHAPNGASIGRLTDNTSSIYPTQYFQGKIDDFALWGRALSANEITKIYKGEKF
jgi:iron-sulfur cluster repair protein YtfE (RIC family)